MPAVQIESIRKTLAARLYNSNNTDPVECSNNSLCPENTSFCEATYSRDYGGRNYEKEKVESRCAKPIDDEPIFAWKQKYRPFYKGSLIQHSSKDSGVFLCNIPNCGSNGTVIEIIQWLTDKYIFPLNTSVFNVITTTSQSTTITTMIKTSTTSTTTPNDASDLFRHFNIIILFFEIILFLH